MIEATIDSHKMQRVQEKVRKFYNFLGTKELCHFIGLEKI
jgi:hypothetical protein